MDPNESSSENSNDFLVNMKEVISGCSPLHCDDKNLERELNTEENDVNSVASSEEGLKNVNSSDEVQDNINQSSPDTREVANIVGESISIATDGENDPTFCSEVSNFVHDKVDDSIDSCEIEISANIDCETDDNSVFRNISPDKYAENEQIQDDDISTANQNEVIKFSDNGNPTYDDESEKQVSSKLTDKFSDLNFTHAVRKSPIIFESDTLKSKIDDTVALEDESKINSIPQKNVHEIDSLHENVNEIMKDDVEKIHSKVIDFVEENHIRDESMETSPVSDSNVFENSECLKISCSDTTKKFIDDGVDKISDELEPEQELNLVLHEDSSQSEKDVELGKNDGMPQPEENSCTSENSINDSENLSLSLDNSDSDEKKGAEDFIGDSKNIQNEKSALPDENSILSTSKILVANFDETEPVTSSLIEENASDQSISEVTNQFKDISQSDESVSVNISISDSSNDGDSNISPNATLSPSKTPEKSPSDSSQSIEKWQPQINNVTSTCDNLSIFLDRIEDDSISCPEVKEEVDLPCEFDDEVREKFNLVNFSIKLEKIAVADDSDVDQNSADELSSPSARATRQRLNLCTEKNVPKLRSRLEMLESRSRSSKNRLSRVKYIEQKNLEYQKPRGSSDRSDDDGRRILRSSGLSANEDDNERISFLHSLNLRSRRKESNENVKSILVKPKVNKVPSKKVSFYLPENSVLKERNDDESTEQVAPPSTSSHKKLRRILPKPAEKTLPPVPPKKRKKSESEVASGKNYVEIEKIVDKYKKVVHEWYECTCCSQRYYLIENVKEHVRSHFPNCLTN